METALSIPRKLDPTEGPHGGTPAASMTYNSSPTRGGTPGLTEVASDGGTPRLQRLRDASGLLDAVTVDPVDAHGGTPALAGDTQVTLPSDAKIDPLSAISGSM